MNEAIKTLTEASLLSCPECGGGKAIILGQSDEHPYGATLDCPACQRIDPATGKPDGKSTGRRFPELGKVCPCRCHTKAYVHYPLSLCNPICQQGLILDTSAEALNATAERLGYQNWHGGTNTRDGGYVHTYERPWYDYAGGVATTRREARIQAAAALVAGKTGAPER